ncbi:hypothetical protein FRC05_010880 [Tulasnella sp. 425]|nr:hypothetical protein FRC05_010880 [Tulasnella sp. 425]
MFSRVFPSFSANKSAARTSSSQPKPAQPAQTTPNPSKKPSRLQKVLQALRLSRSHSKVEQYHHQLPIVQTSPVLSQRATRQARSTPAELSAASTPYSVPNSTFSTTGPTQLPLPQSAATTPATTYPNTPVASASSSLFLASNPAASKRIADLESAVLQLNQDYDRQTSKTNELLNNDLFGQMIALVEERDGDKAARRLAEDQLAEMVTSHATAEEVLREEREEHRQAKSARSQVYYALKKENADLEAALLDQQAKTDLLQVEALHKALVQLGIVDSEDQQYPLAYPVCGDCMGPFLKAVCTAATRQGPLTNSNGGPEPELATAAHRTFEAPGDEGGCSELVSNSRARARSKAPAPTEWLKGGSTRTPPSMDLPNVVAPLYIPQ